MRKFSLINSKGESYDITTTDAFFHSPEGLGFQRDDTYYQVGSRFILTNSSPKQGIITGKLVFNTDDPYGDYQKFLDFCDDNLQLLYEGVGYKRSQYATENILTIDYSVAGGGSSYIGNYDLINGIFTGVYRKFTYGDYASTDWAQVAGKSNSACTIYECELSSNSDQYIKANTHVICNGLNTLKTDEDASLTAGANGVCDSSDPSKVRICLREDCLRGKTINEWIEENKPEFTYVLATPIAQTTTSFEYPYPALYDVTMSSTTSYLDGTTSDDATLVVRYLDSETAIIEERGSTLYFEGDFLKNNLRKFEIDPAFNYENAIATTGRIGGTGLNIVNQDSRNFFGSTSFGDGYLVQSQEMAYVSSGQTYQYYGEILVSDIIPADSNPSHLSATATLSYTSLDGQTTEQIIQEVVSTGFVEDDGKYSCSFTLGGDDYTAVSSPSGNPKQNGWYEYGLTYVLTEDSAINPQTTYYEAVYSFSQISPIPSGSNPKEEGWYEQLEPGFYEPTQDETPVQGKAYYRVSGVTYAQVTNYSGDEDPSAEGWYVYKNAYFLTSDTTVSAGKTYYTYGPHIYEPTYDGKVYLTIYVANCTNIDAQATVKMSIIPSIEGQNAMDYIDELWQVLKAINVPTKSVINMSAYDYKKYYRDVRISKVDKTEINLNGVLEIGIEFRCLSPWKNPFRVLTKTLSDSIPPFAWATHEYKIQNGEMVEFDHDFTPVTPQGSENPKSEGWYEIDAEGNYVLTEDQSVDPQKTYYEFGKTHAPNFEDDETIWDISWGQEAKMSFIVESDGALPSPCRILIFGSAANPQWSHYVNGTVLEEGSVDVDVAADQVLVVDSSEDNFSIVVYNTDGSYAFDAYQQSDFSKDLFIFLRYGENVINVASDGGNYNSNTRVEGYIYYESV